MEGEEGGGIRLSKRFSDKGGEVDNKTKSGTAWSHSYLNQKPWHPLSYPNQRRKWIAEQIQAQHQRRSEEVSREYAQEQEFFRQAALISKKDKEKIETMKAVSFMYVRPPGYNAESAKAAELADESMRDGQQQAQTDGPSTSMPPSGEEAKKKPRPKDVFGRSLPTEQEFEVLKNAPRLETGVLTRAKPFGVEVRNVKCVRCGTFGHQSGDRECPLKDAIMPNEESRLKRDDPLTAILAHTDPSEPLKWELKQKPGISPPRGGFRPDDPNQQIVAEEDIFDEYGGFLGEDVIPELLANFSSKPKKKSKKKTKRKPNQSPSISGEDGLSSGEDDKRRSKKKVSKQKKKERNHSESSSPEIDRHKVKNKHKESYSSEDVNDEKHHRSTKNRQRHSHSYDDSDMDKTETLIPLKILSLIRTKELPDRSILTHLKIRMVIKDIIEVQRIDRIILIHIKILRLVGVIEGRRAETVLLIHPKILSLTGTFQVTEDTRADIGILIHLKILSPTGAVQVTREDSGADTGILIRLKILRQRGKIEVEEAGMSLPTRIMRPM